ncbi:hypothetical protein [Pseudomonas paraveronii]|uniref:hypothetical protein n=1 Tax=Pseudomonas paraveronii TaxID=3040598 RepID=UPI002AB2D46F|nr:hypothetical protein [Pseudomonas sp. V3/K/3/5]
MSLTINHSPFLNVDTTVTGRQPSSTSTAIHQSGTSGGNALATPVTLRHDHFNVANNAMTIDVGGFSRLIDMLEQVFKTMREILSGKNSAPGAFPTQYKPLAAPVDARQLPGHSTLTVDPRGQHALSVLPHVHKSGVSVTKDANANVQVNVNVGHCPCPDTKALANSVVVPRVMPSLPHVPPMAETVRKLDVLPERHIHSHVRPTPSPGVMPGHAHGVTPQPTVPPITPPPLPDTPAPDITSPGPAESRFDSRDWRISPRSLRRS